MASARGSRKMKWADTDEEGRMRNVATGSRVLREFLELACAIGCGLPTYRHTVGAAQGDSERGDRDFADTLWLA